MGGYYEYGAGCRIRTHEDCSAAYDAAPVDRLGNPALINFLVYLEQI